jgi:hypothetical protein
MALIQQLAIVEIISLLRGEVMSSTILNWLLAHWIMLLRPLYCYHIEKGTCITVIQVSEDIFVVDM